MGFMNKSPSLLVLMLNRGIQRPSYHQGKRVLNKKKGRRKKMKTHENKTCLLSTYYVVTIIVM
jgi:hypothetical protein